MSDPECAGTPSLAIRLFGPFEVERDGLPLPRLRSRKGYWLLALLALRQGREVERPWLAGTLWPDSTETSALANLRESLKDLRRALGPEASRLRSPTPHSLCLDLMDAECDVVAFDDAVARGDTRSLEAAVAFYRGLLLEGWTEEWVFQERQAREQAYLTALETVAADAMEHREYGTAARHLQRAVVAEPLRERAHRALMQALAADGDYSGATQTYRELRLLLHRELSAEPAPATSALYEQIRAEARRRAQAGRVPSEGGWRSHVTSRETTDASYDARLVTGAQPRSAAGPRPKTRIPHPLTRLVGREKEVEQVEKALTDSRLVTLTGSGGVGKTRLAICVAERVASDDADEVWFVELSALADPALVPQAVAAVLGVLERPGRPLIETLEEFLGSRQSLLILDNCEHLVEACAQLATSLLCHCRHLRVLATSRQSLGLIGETVRRVPSLSVPDPGEWSRVEGQGSSANEHGSFAGHQPATSDPRPATRDPRPATLLQYEAVRLFVERAEAVSSTFTLTATNAPAIARLCRQLDGIPLAIELAAARMNALSPVEIAERLDDCFPLLTGGSRTALPRHQTLLATIEWSYALLTKAEQRLLRRLSVFSGGWTLDAAEAVCGEEGLGRWALGLGTDGPLAAAQDLRPNAQRPRPDDVLGLLASLVDKSLVLYAEREEARYRLLETVRQYVRDRLLAAGEDAALRTRHRDWFLMLVEQAQAEWERTGDRVSLARLEREHDNLRAALQWCAERGEGEEGLRMGGALHEFWFQGARFSEGRKLLERLLALPGARRTTARVKALRTAQRLAFCLGDHAVGRAHHAESVALARELGDRRSLAWALAGPAATREECQEGLELFRELADPWGIIHLLLRLGEAASSQGDLEAARALYEEGLSRARALGHKTGVAWALDVLGELAISHGDGKAASPLFEECLAIARELDHKVLLWNQLIHLGDLDCDQGDWSKARARCEESLPIARQLGNTFVSRTLRCLVVAACAEGDGAAARAFFAERPTAWLTAECLDGLACLAVSRGQPEWAVRLLRAAGAGREASNSPMLCGANSQRERCVAAARDALGEHAFAAAWREGCIVSLDQAITWAVTG